MADRGIVYHHQERVRVIVWYACQQIDRIEIFKRAVIQQIYVRIESIAAGELGRPNQFADRIPGLLISESRADDQSTVGFWKLLLHVSVPVIF